MRRIRRSAVAALVLFTCGWSEAQEQPVMEPGLWKHRIEFKNQSGRLAKTLDAIRQQLAVLSPAQRETMRRMLGLDQLQLDLTEQSMTNCVTPEQAATGAFEISGNAACERTGSERRGDSVTLTYSCGGKEGNRGEGRITIEEGTRYIGESEAVIQFAGQPERVELAHRGEWLGRDCGALTNPQPTP